jgi:ribosomal protein S18 acetylase RimI-like enzyme
MPDQAIRVETPKDLTSREFASIRALILTGGEVGDAHLSDYLKSAHRIALIVREAQLACVGAIKAERPDYIRTISRKSGYRLDAQNCRGEFGYLVTGPAFRKQGLANHLSTALLNVFDGPLYATTRDDNVGIHKIVGQHGFEHVGQKWRSVEHPNSFLMLWLKKN